jgi:hypothetical protein
MITYPVAVAPASACAEAEKVRFAVAVPAERPAAVAAATGPGGVVTLLLLLRLPPAAHPSSASSCTAAADQHSVAENCRAAAVFASTAADAVVCK